MISFNNEYNINSLKRKNELKKENQFNKFQKNNSRSEQSIQDLVYCCFRSTPILHYLSHTDLFSFEQVAMSHSKLTQPAWNELRQKKCYRLEWKMCSNKPNKDKQNYRLERALFRYVEIFSEVLMLEGNIINNNIMKNISLKGEIKLSFSEVILQVKQQSYENNLNKDESTDELVKKYNTIQKLFEGLSEQFQLWQDFINYNARFSKEKPFSLQEKINDNAPLWGEDLLIAITNHRDDLLTINDYQKLMNKGATSIALIARKSFYTNKGENHLYWKWIDDDKKEQVTDALNEMGILAAEKHDFRALEYNIQFHFHFKEIKAKNFLCDFEKKCKRPLAPITARFAKFERSLEKKSELYDQALEQYKKAGKSPPIDTLIENIEAKKDLLIKQYSKLTDVNKKILSKQIDDYLTQIIEILKSKEIDPSFSIYENKKRLASNWMNIAIIKDELKNFNSANNLQDQDINVLNKAIDECVNQALDYPDEIELQPLYEAALLKENVGQLKEADEIYRQIYSKFSDEIARDDELKKGIVKSYRNLKIVLKK
jgi:hypothetical protein